MESFLLSVHVVAAILLVGPVAVTASLFPRYASGAGSPVAELLHRVTRTYGYVALVVPIAGLAVAVVQGRTSEVWVVVAMALTALAGVLLVVRIEPMQHQVLRTPHREEGKDARLSRLSMLTGIFNLLWVVVVVLMVVRPGTDHS